MTSENTPTAPISHPNAPKKIGCDLGVTWVRVGDTQKKDYPLSSVHFYSLCYYSETFGGKLAEGRSKQDQVGSVKMQMHKLCFNSAAYPPKTILQLQIAKTNKTGHVSRNPSTSEFRIRTPNLKPTFPSFIFLILSEIHLQDFISFPSLLR